jgi:hypothetical protein
MVNISYLIPFLLVQASLVQDTFTLFINNSQAALKGSDISAYKAR